VRKRKDDPISDIGNEQKRLLTSLRSEVKDVHNLLRLLAASQDPEAISRDQMEFLGIVGSRALSPEELELAKKGISIDELRKICGRHIEASQRNNSLRDSIPSDHMLRVVYAEHDLLLYFLSDLMNVVMGLYKSNCWASCRKDTEKIVHIAGHICHMDAHQIREEQIIMPQLAEHHCKDMAKLIFAEHKRLHKHRIKFKEMIESIEKMDFKEWRSNFGDLVQGFTSAVREHIYKEEHILYPEALKAIRDPQVWDDMRTACDDIGLCCF
jgi:uncharacterized protein